MLEERRRPEAEGCIAADGDRVDAWAAEMTALAYGTVPTAASGAPEAVHGGHLMLVDSSDERISISSPYEPIPDLPEQPLSGPPIWREVGGIDSTIEQLARDIAAITQARDALMRIGPLSAEPAAIPKIPPHAQMPSPPLVPRTQAEVPRGVAPVAVATTMGPRVMRRTTDPVPMIVGSVLGFLMITIFSIAAVVINFAR